MRFNTPLRYPGGKGKLTNYFIEVLKANSLENGTYIEPFAGGAGTAMNLLIGGYVKDIVINDADPSIYSFWKVATEHTEELIEAIDDIELTTDEWERQKAVQSNKEKAGTFELGFSTFYLNRTNRSGIIGGGIIGGKGQLGAYKMDARFNKKNLTTRIRNIGNVSEHITVSGMDAGLFLKNDISKFDVDNTLIYIDPPYYEKGKMLYMNYYVKEDHEKLAEIIKTLEHKWILSYDDVSDITEIYDWKKPTNFSINYSSYKAKVGKELFFASDGLIMPENIASAHGFKFIDAKADPSNV